MIEPKHQHTIKRFSWFRGVRISRAQLYWLLLVLAATIAADIAGVDRIYGFTATGLALLPSFAFVMVTGFSRTLGRVGEGILVIVWALIGVFAMAATGGAISPLSAALFLGPLTALGLARGRLAIEMSIFSALVLIACFAAGRYGWTSAVPEPLSAAVLPWSFAVIGQVFVLIWAALDASSLIDETADVNAALTDGDTVPWVLVDTTPQGRIVTVSGATYLRWPALKPGRQFAFDIPAQGEISTETSPTGRPIAILAAPGQSPGQRMLIIPAPGADDAQAAVRARTTFFAGLGHELKTPLNAILGFADLMRAEVRGPMPEAYQDYAGIIHESGQDLMLMVEDILDLAKADAEAHRLEREPIELTASAESVVRQLEAVAARKEVTLKVRAREEVWAEADPRAVRQIWQNLISNAIKYSEPGGKIIISAIERAGAAVISVKDNGVGMSKADLARIAEPFAQGENARDKLGTGLGLAVVKTFADLHGGRVIIDTAPGEGAQVQVTLPLAGPHLLADVDEAAE